MLHFATRRPGAKGKMQIQKLTKADQKLVSLGASKARTREQDRTKTARVAQVVTFGAASFTGGLLSGFTIGKTGIPWVAPVGLLLAGIGHMGKFNAKRGAVAGAGMGLLGSAMTIIGQKQSAKIFG